MAVKPLPLSAAAVERILRQIASADVRVILGTGLHDTQYRTTCDHRQIVRCIRSGRVQSRPVIDGHGNATCTVASYSTGEAMRLQVVICTESRHGGRQIIVTKCEVE